MKLTRIELENYRRLDDTEIEVRDHLVLVGANDVGKSSLLRALDLVLGASTAQLYSNLGVEDFRDASKELRFEVQLVDFSKEEMALFVDEIYVDPATNDRSLSIQLTASVDASESLSITRIGPHAGTGRQLSRDQIAGLGWKFLSATAQTRDLRDDRRSALDEMLRAVDLGGEKASFDAIATSFQDALNNSTTLGDLRTQLAGQLSKALPEKLAEKDLSFVSGASADDDVLSDVRLRVTKGGVEHELSQQSDGTRALYAIALYDLMSAGANVVGIDEPEIHLHPTSQRSLARLLRASSNQKVLATHSSDIVGAFDADSIVVVRPGGTVVQPSAGFLAADERTFVKWWVRDKLEPLTATRVVTVEGLSDRIILERVADLTDRNLDRLGVSVIETDGASEIRPVAKLFGSTGFNLAVSRLIDLDAEQEVADALGIAVADLRTSSVFTSQRDLEDEYVRALGGTNVQAALASGGHFSKNELANCTANGPAGTYTDADVAAFCRVGKRKVRAALSVLPILTAANASAITSIDYLLSEIAP
ncbi:ATP-dependent nuclease [Agromyces aerolatus]|uniref:ATP-dependent nuclease n=1 Tax=Agromyces sp. LY-1074 TaxID=3074080 RepID=UPI00286456C2|nr:MULTISPECIES: AAA family ATPase [unclassified Agromyces]MDR5700722.1 AAA family ATPase [Agromyces sp. LY-1074]MDR5707243.1 AAA family ATPase [Agromyces sp. LY-1358]